MMASFLDITDQVQADENLKASLQEKEVLLKELYHRTKNNMQVIMSMLTLQSQNIEDENMLQIFKETSNRIQSMALVHEKLYHGKDLSKIDLKGYIKDLLILLMRSHKIESKKVTTKTHMESVWVWLFSDDLKRR